MVSSTDCASAHKRFRASPSCRGVMLLVSQLRRPRVSVGADLPRPGGVPRHTGIWSRLSSARGTTPRALLWPQEGTRRHRGSIRGPFLARVYERTPAPHGLMSSVGDSPTVLRPALVDSSSLLATLSSFLSVAHFSPFVAFVMGRRRISRRLIPSSTCSKCGATGNKCGPDQPPETPATPGISGQMQKCGRHLRQHRKKPGGEAGGCLPEPARDRRGRPIHRLSAP